MEVFLMVDIIVIIVFLLFLALLVLYYSLLIKAIIEMLNMKSNTVLLTFAFIASALLFFVLGIVVLIVWSKHKKTLV